MKILKPTLSHSLTLVDDAASIFDEDESIADVHIDSQALVNLKLKHLSIASSLCTKVDLSSTHVEKLQLLDCEFKSCNFTASSFPNSSWHVITVDNARCSGMQLTESTFKNVTFKNSKLELMNFRFSTLQNVVFEDCVLDDVDFNNATLRNIEFVNCSIRKISFNNARMFNVDLSHSQLEEINGAATLKGAAISYDQLMQLAPLLALEAGIKVK